VRGGAVNEQRLILPAERRQAVSMSFRWGRNSPQAAAGSVLAAEVGQEQPGQFHAGSSLDGGKLFGRYPVNDCCHCRFLVAV